MDLQKYTEFKDRLPLLEDRIQNNPKEINSIIDEYNEVKSFIKDFEDVESLKNEILKNNGINDPALKDIIEEENKILEVKIQNIENKYKGQGSRSKGPYDEKNVILEIRPGTGGDEASLFAREIYEMYKKYIKDKGWREEIVDMVYDESGGIKQLVTEIKGNLVYGDFKYESGVHRVQRVPKTESSGRIHTSTISVVVLPIVKESDFEINDKDLKIDYYRASGAGGQHVNKTSSAVRIVHIPTGIMATSQKTSSQLQNKENAIEVLRSRLYLKNQEDKAKNDSKLRKEQMGGGERSEKIRTYNFLQDRITDHRLGKQMNFHIQDIFERGKLQELIDLVRNNEEDAQSN
ncbi:MAG: PCRF domain-containing protein [Patescibacteria group bacterium]